jgi:hypothetical protein
MAWHGMASVSRKPSPKPRKAKLTFIVSTGNLSGQGRQLGDEWSAILSWNLTFQGRRKDGDHPADGRLDTAAVSRSAVRSL